MNKAGSKDKSALLAGLGQNRAPGNDTRPRAPWRTSQEFKKLLNQGVCVRCTKAGHSAKFYPTFRSAPRPNVDVNVASFFSDDDLNAGKEDS